MTKHVLITGGLGFIGHNLARHYLDNKYTVTIVDNLHNYKTPAALIKYRVEHLRNNFGNCTFFQCNIRDFKTIIDRLKELDSMPRSIIHLASQPNQAAVEKDPYSSITNMQSGVYSVSQLGKAINAKVIFASSSMVYGNFTSIPQSEDSTLDPVNLYGLLKKQGEELLKLNSLRHIIVRPSAVYGPGDNAGRVLGKWINSFLTNKPILINNSTTLLDFTYVDDLVRGIAAAEEFGVIGETYNITRGQARTLKEAALLIKEMTDSRSFIEEAYAFDTTTEPLRGTLDISKAARDLNYRSRYSLEHGLKKYIEWVKENQNLYD